MTKGIVLACLAPLCAVAEIVCALGPGAAGYKPAEDQRPTADTMQVAGRINAAMKVICGDHCPQIGLFRNPTAAGALLALDAGQAKLAYAPPFFATVYGAYADSGIIAIVAHQMGHALDDTMGAAWVNPKWGLELRADSWAGCILGRMKLKDAEIAATMAALAKYPAPAHPAWPARLASLRAGFGHCGGEAGGN